MYVKDNTGDEKMITTQRYLTQLGFGNTKVHKIAIGEHVTLTTTMVKVTIKMPSSFSWNDEMCNGSTIAKYLAERIPAPAFDAIQVRMDCCLRQLWCMNPNSKNSSNQVAKESLFIKVHAENDSTLPLEPLWLGDDVSLEAAASGCTRPNSLWCCSKES